VAQRHVSTLTLPLPNTVLPPVDNNNKTRSILNESAFYEWNYKTEKGLVFHKAVLSAMTLQ
jgi:hypothetical protein